MTITGKEYVERIDKLNNEVWLDGKKLFGNISEHPAFRGVIKSKASLFDLQNDPTLTNLLTYDCPILKQRINFSFFQPKSSEDLEKRKQATELWARMNLGLLGRSPDYVNTGLMALGAANEFFGKNDTKFGDNIKNTVELAMKNDLSFTHTFINPQVNRSFTYFEESSSETIAAKVINENNEGIIIQGARLLATQGGITDEVLVLPAGGNTYDDSYVYGFTVPSNTPGLKFICRESFVYNESTFDHPLGSRFEEMDSIVVFDHVLVPWEKVFIYKDREIMGNIFLETNFNTMLLYQAIARMVVKTEFIIGLAESIINAINIREYQHVKEKVSEMIVVLEVMKSLHLSSRINGTLDKWGTFVPDPKPLNAAINYYPRVYPRLVEIIQLLGGSGLILLPTEKSFESPIREAIDLYLQGTNSTAEEKVKLFRIAWDLCMSSFGSRQTHFERFFFGDPVRLSTGLYNGYPKDSFTKFIQDLL